MKFKLNIVLASLMGLASSMSAIAEDIELYVNYDVETNEKPRVLFIFDTSGSMDWSVINGDNQSCYIKQQNKNNKYDRITCFESKSSYSDSEQCYIEKNNKYVAECHDRRIDVARNAITQLVNDNVDIDFGLMRLRSSDGGYVLARIAAERKFLLDKIDNLPASGSTPLSETLWEAYLYITGQDIDYAEDVSNRDLNAETSSSSEVYKSPFMPISGEPLRCDNSVNIILMSDGDPTNDSESNEDIEDLYEDTFNSENPPVFYSNYLAALAKVIHGTKDVEVDLYPATTEVHDKGRVYTIGFGTGMSDKGKTILGKTAEYGGGQYLHANTSAQLSDALKNTISQIREVNDSFSSPSVASNNVDQTRSRDAIYFAMFYPETGARWSGNLKKLKVSGSQVVDSTGSAALDENGLISKDAKTFWLPSGQPADGNAVAQGGVNLHLATRDPESRKLYTNKLLGGIVEFDTSIVSDLGDLFGGDATLSSSDIKWARGIDVDDEDNDGATVDQRHDIFGDPLHSKPVAIDYGNDDIRILIGTNAGFLHMFKDSDNTVSESWAFIPAALYNNIKPLRENRAETKVYGMDGAISVYFSNKSLNGEGLNDGIIDASKGDEVWAFAGMRRGGNNYYALDITAPNAPKKLWDKPIEGGKGDFTELAQSWSKPQIAYIKAFGDKPLLVFGAGYDTNKDAAIRSEDKIGRGIYIVEAKTGKKVWALTPSENGFTGKHSIAADLTTLDSDYDGYIDRIYASDTGGNIWRIDMPGSDTSEFSHFKLAELGSTSATQDRRFFYKPLVARTMFSKVTQTTKDGKTITTRLDTPYDAIVIGSGNRSKPTDTNEQDQLFMIRDENTVTKSFKTGAPATIKASDLMLMNSDPFSNLLDDVDGFIELEADLAKVKGWRYELATGEKSLAAATVVGGVAYFTSFTPASDTATVNQCSLSGGGGSLYAFHLLYGTKVYDKLKFATSYDVPDTPQLYFGEGNSCADTNNDGKCDGNTDIEVKLESQFYLIGPGIKGKDAQNPMRPVDVIGPGLKVVDGKIQLVNKESIGFGFKTQQTYIYKREENDEIIPDEED
ncbi:type IV pilus assembly protein PilY1 [Pseudoalteromonas translucida KMM 520]|uniref:Type IV pilus assembly protein PilY1 n=1 Tax=Pseudoalteromonas translucida KMM 520 TaxID=1315283 RepID=A0A0U2X4X2_9GAMM|nr:PilC/PilY family type IV pilus protein [Pseudoalteromonas translucida]ALS32334.1 type IV pilus assembly protein PilY1 [Pseudoalteromonas translucida KMM 520]